MSGYIKQKGRVAAALFGILALSAQGASFDCAKASTQAERLICDNPYISELDDKLGVAYKAALKNKQQADRIRQEQRDWLQERDEYYTAWEMLTAYEARLKALGVTNIDPDRTEKPGERYRYFITDEVEFIENESESRPFCRAVLDALIKTKPSKDHLVCTDSVLFKLPGVGDPPWEKLDLAQHGELAKKLMTLSKVGSDEYFRKQKHMPERYPTSEQQQRSLENMKQMGAELFMLHLPPEYYGDLVLVTLRVKTMECGKPVGSGEYANNAWVTPDLKEIASRPDVVDPSEGRPLLYRGRLYLVSAGISDAVIGIPGRRTTGSVCAISRIID